MNEKYNWKKLETEFITRLEPISPTAFAKEKGIRKETLLPIAKKNDWKGKRDKHLAIVDSSVTSSIAKYDSEKRVKQAEKMSNIVDVWLEQFDGDLSKDRIMELSVKDIKAINEMRNSLAGGFKKGSINLNLTKNFNEMSDEELEEISEIQGVD